MLLVAKNVSGYVHRFVANTTFVNALVVLGITNSYERVHIVFPFNNWIQEFLNKYVDEK